MRQSQYDSDLHTDWPPGSPIRFVSEWEGQRFEQWGQVLTFGPPASLSYTLFAPRPDLEDRPENHFTMTCTLADEAGGTELAIIQDDPRPGADSTDGEADDAENPVLTALKQQAETLARA